TGLERGGSCPPACPAGSSGPRSARRRRSSVPPGPARSPDQRRDHSPPATCRVPPATSQPRHLLALLEVALEEHGILEAVLGDLGVERAALEQLVVPSAVDDPPAVEHDDLVGERDRREAVGDDERRPP